MVDRTSKRRPDVAAKTTVTTSALDVATTALISDHMREWLKGVEDRYKADRPSQCWKCCEWHTDLKEVEFRGWLCRSCR